VFMLVYVCTMSYLCMYPCVDKVGMDHSAQLHI